jgi:outer membrane protein OmpA-like peptidoglycan-associated protein
MKKKFLLSGACLTLCLGAVVIPSGAAKAQEMGSLSYYNLTDAEYHDNYNAWKLFLEYHLNREPCQNYQAPPAGFVMRGCHVYRVESAVPVAVTETQAVTATETTTAVDTAATSYYTINFNFDKSNIRDSEKDKLAEAVREIKKYNPAIVTVSGYAGRIGTADYNQRLSERRSNTVANALVAEGINGAIIEQKAYGETHLAVPTADGVRMPANRRVVITFNH